MLCDPEALYQKSFQWLREQFQVPGMKTASLRKPGRFLKIGSSARGINEIKSSMQYALEGEYGLSLPINICNLKKERVQNDLALDEISEKVLTSLKRSIQPTLGQLVFLSFTT